jgi:hypothetical protein
MTERRILSVISAVWGVTGVALLLGSAVYRLTPFAVEALKSNFAWYHYLFLFFVLVFMAYFEGYQAFQQGFSPRVAARARYLRSHRNALHAFFAPLFCMGYFHAPRKRRIASLSVTAGIIVLILLVRLLPQPWRGIVDAGVIVGLAWGLLALFIFTFHAFTAERFDYSPEVPDR